jgi:hypothetical protein
MVICSSNNYVAHLSIPMPADWYTIFWQNCQLVGNVNCQNDGLYNTKARINRAFVRNSLNEYYWQPKTAPFRSLNFKPQEMYPRERVSLVSGVRVMLRLVIL